MASGLAQAAIACHEGCSVRHLAETADARVLVPAAGNVWNTARALHLAETAVARVLVPSSRKVRNRTAEPARMKGRKSAPARRKLISGSGTKPAPIQSA